MMDIFRFLRPKEESSASVVRNRLQVVIAHQRASNGNPEFVLKIQREILAVLSKYGAVDPDQIKVSVDRSDRNVSFLELNIPLPDGTDAVAG